MAERTSAGIAHALRDGLARVRSAPAILVGTFAIARVLDVPMDADFAPLSVGTSRQILVAVLFWAFVYGGALDRYARRRPTRAIGFFAACGAHWMPLTRLALLPVLLQMLLVWKGEVDEWSPVLLAASALVMFVDLIVASARIRLVVEDRRSATGAILSGARFIWRNLSAVLALIVVYSTLAYVVRITDAALLSRAGWIREAMALAELVVKLSAYSSGIALFQSRLAHAGYTAAPALEWPESASVEAITNASSRMTS